MTLRAFHALASLALALAAAACASTVTAPTTTGAAGTAAATVTYKDFQVAPATVTVAKGEAVRFTNADSTTHTVTSGVPGSKTGKFEHQIAGGAQATVAFDQAGTFEFFCEFHVTMRGRVEVK